MKYIGTPNYTHGTEERLGVLMVNLGTPAAPETGAVRRYLAEFLSDPRIIELPRWLWMIILHGVILRIRPARSAKAYREVWSAETGSPLLSISRQQSAALAQELEKRFGDHVVVALGMRYAQPSIDSAITELEAANVRRMIVLPMYPQYSGTTTASVFDAVASRLQKTRWIPEMRFINQYCDHDAFIQSLANSVRESWEANGRGDLLVTSGLGGRFPPGYPVAKVTAVTRNPGQPFASVLAQPKSKLDQARETMLVWTLDNIQGLNAPEAASSGNENAEPEPNP